MSFNIKDIPAQSLQLQEFLNDPTKKYCFLNGPGGTGKTYSVSELLKLDAFCGYPTVYKFATPTGKAASVAKGYNMEAETFHAMFELLNYNSSKDMEAHILNTHGSHQQYYNKVIKRKFYDENVTVVFFDEISMFNNEMLRFIVSTFDINTNKLIKLVFSGDYHQFDAVITDHLKKDNPDIDGSLEYMTMLYNDDPSVFDVIEYNTRYRSPIEFDDFNEDLHNLRSGSQTKSKKAALVKLFDHCNVYDGELSEDIKQNLMFIEHSKTRVKDVNNEFIYRLLGRNLEDSDYSRVHIVVGNKTYKKIDDVPSVDARRSIDSMQFEEEVALIKGSKILFLVNSESYKNGDEGFIEEIKRDSVLIRKKVNDQFVLMEVEKHEYKSDPNLKLNITVIQWPFDLAYARTSHKSQGDGFSNLHLNFMECFNNHNYHINDIYARALANWKFIYVCISRIIDPSTVWISKGSINAIINEPDFFKHIDFDRLNFMVDKYENNGYIKQRQ